MAKLHKGKYCGKRKNWVDRTIGYPQSQTNRTLTVPVQALNNYELDLETGAIPPGTTYEEWRETLKGESPYIGSNGNWWIGDEDLGVPAEGEPGESPYIGDNGNWWVGDEDTGVPAEPEEVSPETDDNIFN